MSLSPETIRLFERALALPPAPDSSAQDALSTPALGQMPTEPLSARIARALAHVDARRIQSLKGYHSRRKVLARLQRQIAEAESAGQTVTLSVQDESLLINPTADL